MASHSVIAENDAAVADEALVRRCLGGDVAGWQALYELCQAPLQSAIRNILGDRARDRELVEELTAQVWYALVDHDGALLSSFQAVQACRLATFVAAIARNLVRNYLRSERRRRLLESGIAVGRSECRTENSEDLHWMTEELRATLTAREDLFFDWCLTPLSARTGTFSGSDNADHQLRHRLRKKLRGYFGNQP